MCSEYRVVFLHLIWLAPILNEVNNVMKLMATILYLMIHPYNFYHENNNYLSLKLDLLHDYCGSVLPC